MSTIAQKFGSFTSLKFTEQSKAFLNAYFFDNNVKSELEKIWEFTHLFIELDIEKLGEGSDLDEFNAHRFLEKVGETKSVVSLREQLKEKDLVFNKRFSFIEYLLFRYNKKVDDFVSRPQGDNSEEIAKAQALLEEVQKALEIAQKKSQEAAAKAKEALAAENEQKAALSGVQAEERARDAKSAGLKAKIDDPSIGVVASGRAKNELAQHLSEDPLPLRKAKITLEAATKRAEKARIAAQEAASQAEAKLKETNEMFHKAQAYLDEVKSKSGSGGQGSLWWLQRELDEKKKYLPKRLQV